MILAVVAAIGCVAQLAEEAAVSAKVSLADGSQLLGTLNAPLVVVTSFGKKEIPLAQISALDFAKDGVKVRFHNKDVLSGTLEDTAFAFKTVFNDVRLDYSQIKSVKFSGMGAQDMNTEGLLLHVQFDSDSEDLSRFDARMDARNARIVEGPDGNGKAMLLDSEDATVAIHLPFSPYLTPECTIEFWSKFPQPHAMFGPGDGPPFFFNIVREGHPNQNQMLLGFVWDAGGGRGGLLGRIWGFADATTHVFGTVSNIADTGLLGDTLDGWHHYAFIWKWDGFAFPEGTGKNLLVVVDGKVVASSVKMPDRHDFVGLRDKEAKFHLLIHDNNSNRKCPIAMSDLKIWNYAKTPDQLGWEEMRK